MLLIIFLTLFNSQHCDTTFTDRTWTGNWCESKFDTVPVCTWDQIENDSLVIQFSVKLKTVTVLRQIVSWQKRLLL